MLIWPGNLPDPSVRTIEDLRPVLADPDCRATGPLYSMYRDLALTEKDRRWLSGHALRYDITVISPRDLCGEKAKTKGHYHPANANGIGYPEIYQVIDGSAHYLLQRRDLSDAVLVRAVEGDLVLVPPFYGHVTINNGPGDLVMANLVSSRFESEYGDYESRRGAAYYEFSDGNLRSNPCYDHVPALRKAVTETILDPEQFPEGPLYGMIGNDVLNFLNRPEKYPSLFSRFP
jgi:glucose-6-phosphate isomerase